MDLDRINKLAYDQMGSKSSHSWKEKGNKYYHGKRVAHLALRLREIVLPEDTGHDEILTVAAWFHDIRNGIEDHAKRGADKARDVLRGYCSAAELDEICGIISVHDDRKHGRETYSEYIKLHQDADLLDHFGTYDIWMFSLASVAYGETIEGTMDWFINQKPMHDTKYRKELNYEISKLIFDEKSEYVRKFGERFQVEGVEGGIWKEDEILAAYRKHFEQSSSEIGAQVR